MDLFSLFFLVFSMNKNHFLLLFFFFLFLFNFNSFWWGSYFFFSKKFLLVMVFLCFIVILLSFSCKQNMTFFLNMSILFGLLFFLSNKVLVLFLFFEMSLIPIIFIILMWGVQPERVSAFYFLLLYTVFSSFPLFFFIISLENQSLFFLSSISTVSIFCFSLAFLVKLPMIFFHIWLPKAHVEAPTLGSIILAGLLLKLGGFGLILIMSCFFNFWTILLLFISSWGTLLSCLVSCFQSDSKSLVAFSSICHLNFSLFLLLILVSFSKNFNFFTMMVHGINSSFMFWVAGSSFHQNLSRNMFWLKSLSFFSISILCSSMIIFSSNFGVPPLIPCFQEILFFSSMINFSWKFWFIGMFYILLVCYFSLFFLINLSLKTLEKGSSNLFVSEILSFLVCISLLNLFLLSFI